MVGHEAGLGGLVGSGRFVLTTDDSDWEIVRLHYSPDGGIATSSDGLTGGSAIGMSFEPQLPDDVKAKFPHLSGYHGLRIGASDVALVPEILKGQFAVQAADPGGTPFEATSVQIPGVLDDLYTYEGALGVEFDGGAPTVRVWAPTARSVTLNLYDDPSTGTSSPYAMTGDPMTGVWSVTGDAGWKGKYYLFEIEVYVPSTGQVETNRVTDPYSVGLSADSQRSQIVDLGDPALMPPGWAGLEKPGLAQPEDIAIYELHVRDFSIADETVPEHKRGTFAAFGETGSQGMQHLSDLAGAGLSHVHLLPSFDFATVPERAADRVEVDQDLLATYPPDSDAQQAAIYAIRDQDGFNWGYDPWHYTTPEGSYSTDPDGSARIVEFREMVRSLNQAGLRVVMDVVYNHTTASGQSDRSVLDRIVPGYYHRLSASGALETSSCCANTASEHNMMEKLMIDSVLTWARAYKVDGFRFDLMGHHSKANMLKLRAALDALTVEQDGVDGRSIYLYGEGWNFGEVANDARFVQATQVNMAGTGIGSFSDRLRDGVRGGNPFSDPREQGFINGLYYDPNGRFDVFDPLGSLLTRGDWIRVGLAGGLAAYTFVDRNGNTVRADQVDYFGQQAGYTADPEEHITYIAAHDNETLFDATQLKAPVSNSMADRVRIQNLGNSIVGLGQGIPFFHAGQEILRSKSMDRDSYNSGDWFNQVDWTLATTNWGKGLPVADKNQDNWPIMQPLLADPALAPGTGDLLAAREHFQEILAIRRSSGLFRLASADAIQARLAFHNTGPSQIPGLIEMSLSDDDGSVDRLRRQVVVVFNANDDPVQVPAPNALDYRLHPIQAMSTDILTRKSAYDPDQSHFEVPGRTTAVFEALRPADEQIELIKGDIESLKADGRLNKGQAKALVSKLDAAIAALSRGRSNAAGNQLNAFLNQLSAFVKAGILDGTEADPIADAARDVLHTIG